MYVIHLIRAHMRCEKAAASKYTISKSVYGQNIYQKLTN